MAAQFSTVQQSSAMLAVSILLGGSEVCCYLANPRVVVAAGHPCDRNRAPPDVVADLTPHFHVAFTSNEACKNCSSWFGRREWGRHPCIQFSRSQLQSVPYGADGFVAVATTGSVQSVTTFCACAPPHMCNGLMSGFPMAGMRCQTLDKQMSLHLPFPSKWTRDRWPT